MRSMAKVALVVSMVSIAVLGVTVAAQKQKPAPTTCNFNGYCELNEGSTCGDCALPRAGNSLDTSSVSGGGQFFHTGSAGIVQYRWVEGAPAPRSTWISATPVSRASATGVIDYLGNAVYVARQRWATSTSKRDSTYWERTVVYASGSTGQPSFLGPEVKGGNTWASLLYDFDGDGKAELAMADNECPDCHVTLYKWDGYPSNGNVCPLNQEGVCGFRKVWRSSALGGAIWSLAAGDVNGDGTPELLASLSNLGQIAVFSVAVNGQGTFQVTGPVMTQSVGAYNVNQIAVADVDGDTLSEIIGGGTSNTLIVWHSNGSSYEIAAQTPSLGAYTSYVAAGDLDRDNTPEIAVGTAGKLLNVYRFIQGSGLVRLASRTVGAGPYNLSIADVDLDGKGEIVDGYSGVHRLTLSGTTFSLTPVNFSFGLAGTGSTTVVR